jgi:fucose 4-O-acetylase-like acetyltransferase
MKDRIQALDAIKAFAIFLVVLGHILQKTILNFDDNYLFKFIYSFHMPLFIFISGFVTYRVDGLKNRYLSHKFMILILPYFSWFLIIMLISFFNGSLQDKTQILDFLLYPDNGLWFLWVLFWMHLVLYICYSVSEKYTTILLSLFYIIYFLLIFTSGIDNILCVKTFAFLFPFFFLGYMSNKDINLFKTVISKWWVLLPFMFFLPIFWHRTNKLTISFISLNPILITYLYKFLLGFIGIIVVFGFFLTIKKFNKYILTIGKNTLPIYAMNFIFINWIGFILNFILNTFLYYLSALFLSFFIILSCLIVNFYLKKNRILGLFLLGNNLDKPINKLSPNEK